MNFNKIILAGELLYEPELKYTPTQCAVVNFALVTHVTWTSKDNKKREEICPIECFAFAHTANAIAKYIHKGDTILIEGRLAFESWVGRDGEKHSAHKIAVSSVQFLPQDKEAKQKKINEERATEDKKHKPLTEDDIPF